MRHEAILALQLEAENLAASAVADLGGDLEKVAGKASQAAAKIDGAFEGTGRSLSVGIGAAVDSLVTGGSITDAMVTLGGFMSGELVENFGGQAIEKFTSGGLVTMLTAPLATVGSALGGILAAAIPIGMALLPVLLIAALVAAVTVLIVNEGIRNKVIGFARGLVETLISFLSKFLGGLPDAVGRAFAAAWSFVINQVAPFILQLVTLWLSLPLRLAGLGLQLVGVIVQGLYSLPGRVADIIRDAFVGAIRNLNIDIGPIHIHGGSISVDLPHFAGGVTNFGGGLALVGERGPEIVALPRGSDVIPNGRVAAAGGLAPNQVRGVFIQGLDEDDIDAMVDRKMMFRLNRAAASRASY